MVYMRVVMCVNWNSRAGLASPAKLNEYEISGLGEGHEIPFTGKWMERIRRMCV